MLLEFFLYLFLCIFSKKPFYTPSSMITITFPKQHKSLVKAEQNFGLVWAGRSAGPLQPKYSLFMARHQWPLKAQTASPGLQGHDLDQGSVQATG